MMENMQEILLDSTLINPISNPPSHKDSTMTFKLLIKDYDSSKALSSKKIQIKNTDSKQSYKQISNANGELIFEIEESQKGDFFSITIIDEGYEATPYYLTKDLKKQDSTKNTTQKILTPNNYQTHPAILYFKARISLLFNGYNLLILKGDLILKSYKARSGKALNAQEKQDLQINKGYKDFIADGEVFYCLNKDWQKQDCALLPEGDYYIKAQSSKDIQIYTDKTCHNIAKSKKDSFYIYSQGDFEGIKLIEFAYFLEYLNTYTQERSIVLKVAYSTQNSNQITFILQADSKEQLDLESPFAQGTYIELEAKTLKQVEHITWGYVKIKNKLEKEYLLNETTPINDFKAIRLDEANERFYKQSNSKITLSYQIGFHLPLCDDEFEYIIIFAFDSEVKFLPNITDAHLILNTSFKASSNKPISTLINNYHSLLYWNQKSCISIYEAEAFLKANINKRQSYENDIDYFTNYPQLAGKIAYMYFCFDMSKEEFVERVTGDNGEYRKDRDNYIATSKMILQATESKMSFFSEYKILIKSSTNTQKRKDFITRLILAVCHKFKLPLRQLVFFKEDSGIYGYYSRDIHIIAINQYYLHDLKEMLKTAFHEIRHFYIDIYYNPNTTPNLSILKRYLYWSLQFYIDNPIIFDGFKKPCDDDNFNNVGCLKGSYQDAYFTQPNERDPRFVETQICKILP